jgi:hypothetical protein
MASVTTAPGFTAYYAHKRAMRTAQRLAPTITTPPACMFCGGSKIIRSNITTISVEGSSTETNEMPCFHCKDGKNAPLTIDNLYSKLIWCNCKNKDTSFFMHAADGRRVFGNTTYLCGCCGFVKQFG